MRELAEMLNPVYNITDIIPAMMFFVIGARRPKAKALPRWLWKNGRLLILFSIAAFLAIFTFRTQFALSTYGTAEWAVIGINGVIAFYIGTSEFIRDLFNEFPNPLETESLYK